MSEQILSVIATGDDVEPTPAAAALDPLLQTLAGAGDDARRALLEEVLRSVGEPAITAVLRSRRRAARMSKEDLEDIRALALYRLVRRLSVDLREQPIERFRDYAAAVARCTWDEHVRQLHPERETLRKRLAYFCRNHPVYAVWQHVDEMLCGRRSWQGLPSVALPPEPIALPPLAPSRSLLHALDALFLAVGGPLTLSAVVSVLTPWLVHRRVVRIDCESLPAPSHDGEAAAHMRLHLAEVWREIQLLPLEQRIALLLNLRDGEGRGAMRFLPLTGVATVAEIATALGLPVDELARIWGDLPLADAAIAKLLAVPRQRVINLRSAARRRLARRLDRSEKGP